MELDELMDFLKEEDKRLTDYFGIKDKEKMILARTVKLQEEVGELCEQVLSSFGIQRRHKIESFTKDKLSDELVDVVITALLLAVTLNIDIKSAIGKNIEKIKNRS